MRILIAEDDQLLADGLSMVLRDNGYAIDIAPTGADADAALMSGIYDLLILDLGLPSLNGLEILKRLRDREQTLPVLILTARDRLEDRVLGLDLGANDYITKPFALPELEARIRALLRKNLWSNRREITFGSLSFNTASRVVTANQQVLDLSARELAVLEILLQRLGQAVNKDQITDLVSSWDLEVTGNAIVIAIHRLRKKLEDHGITIKASRGLGYRLEESS
jgi:DNA-binding response OmpR family regulator